MDQMLDVYTIDAVDQAGVKQAHMFAARWQDLGPLWADKPGPRDDAGSAAAVVAACAARRPDLAVEPMTLRLHGHVAAWEPFWVAFGEPGTGFDERQFGFHSFPERLFLGLQTHTYVAEDFRALASPFYGVRTDRAAGSFAAVRVQAHAPQGRDVLETFAAAAARGMRLRANLFHSHAGSGVFAVTDIQDLNYAARYFVACPWMAVLENLTCRCTILDEAK